MNKMAAETVMGLLKSVLNDSTWPQPYMGPE